jgi:glycogen synthase
MRVSVVVCTYNRADSLRVTLDALRYQTFTDFEVVVVNGPSTDHTADVLAEWSGRIKAVENPAANLSISRNLGIRAAAGDLVAFIDDDAIPEFDWLADIVAAFETDETGEVAGVGGLVFDHTGTRFQFRFAASSRLGEPKLSDTTPFDDLCIPGGFWFPYLQGTNAVFRRQVLDEVGGFDETFDYYLDETDLCARIVDAGYVLRQLDDAHVHHKFLASSMRNDDRIFTRWYPVIKNLTYFGFRHAAEELGAAAVLDKAHAELDFRVGESAMHERAGRVPPGTAERTRREGRDAIEDGQRLAKSAATRRLEPMALPVVDFEPYAVRERSDGLTVVVVSSAFDTTVSGGISRFITDVAPELVELGHEVRVITRAVEVETGTVDFEDGLWIHRVAATSGGALPGTAPHIDTFATAALDEVRRIHEFRPIDVVYGPAWDLEVLPVIRSTGHPVVALLATPVAVTNHLDETLPYTPDPYASLLLDLEHELFTTATLLHADSEAVLETVARRYCVDLGDGRAAVALLGSRDRGDAITTPPRGNGDISLLYVGRIEPRKGVDTLLDAFEQLAPAMPHLRLVLAGAENLGEAQIRGPWLERHACAPWVDRVSFLGAVDDDSLERCYDEADIVVVPSRFESFGLTLVEAMRHSRPVVSTTGGAIPEVIEDGVTGVLVEPGDAAGLARAIAELASSSERRDSMAAAGRARYDSQFTIARAARRLDDVLRGAVGRAAR